MLKYSDNIAGEHYSDGRHHSKQRCFPISLNWDLERGFSSSRDTSGAVHAAYDPKLPCKQWEERAWRTFSRLVLLDLNTAAWKLDLLSGFSGANELRNLSQGYHAATEESTAGKLWTFWLKIELKKEKHPKLPRTSLKVTSRFFIFRSSTNKKLLQGKSTETKFKIIQGVGFPVPLV